MFNERIKQLCEDRQIPQRKLATALKNLVDTRQLVKLNGHYSS
jgi:hypothetical protein